MRYFGAVDPGKNGGYTVVMENGIIVFARRFKFDEPGDMAHDMRECDIVLFERAQGAAGQANQFEYGRAFGRAEGAILTRLQHTNAEVLYCAPQWWKGKLGLSSDKKQSLKVAREKYGHGHFLLEGDEGVAEAALLCQILLSPKLLSECRANNALRERPKKKRVSYKL